MSDKNMLWIRRETLVGIANAIRSKKGTTDLIPVPELETEILSIVAGDSSWCGEYVDGTGYKKGAIVSFEGNIYICIKDLDEMQEPTNAEYWKMLNEEGEVIPEHTEVEDFTVFVEGLEGEVNIGYSVSQKVALPEGSPAILASVSDANFIANNIKKGVSVFGLTGAYEAEDKATPIEVSTEAEMTALLTSGEVGGVYKYTGETTDTYENGALYVLEVSE